MNCGVFDENKNIIQKLVKIQQRLKAPKDKYNSFGKYKYRSAESIIECVKPILEELNCVLVCTARAGEMGGHTRLAVRATLIDADSGEYLSAASDVREDEQRAGMCASQNSGSSESFAKKYALGNLFAIDDSKDSDSDDLSPKSLKNRAQTNAEAAQGASEAKGVSTPTPAAKKPEKAVKAVKSLKMRRAWAEYIALESSKKLSDTAKTKFFCAICLESSGKSDPNALNDEDWDKVLGAIDAMKAI